MRVVLHIEGDYTSESNTWTVITGLAIDDSSALTTAMDAARTAQTLGAAYVFNPGTDSEAIRAEMLTSVESLGWYSYMWAVDMDRMRSTGRPPSSVQFQHRIVHQLIRAAGESGTVVLSDSLPSAIKTAVAADMPSTMTVEQPAASTNETQLARYIGYGTLRYLRQDLIPPPVVDPDDPNPPADPPEDDSVWNYHWQDYFSAHEVSTEIWPPMVGDPLAARSW